MSLKKNIGISFCSYGNYSAKDKRVGLIARAKFKAHGQLFRVGLSVPSPRALRQKQTFDSLNGAYK